MEVWLKTSHSVWTPRIESRGRVTAAAEGKGSEEDGGSEGRKEEPGLKRKKAGAEHRRYLELRPMGQGPLAVRVKAQLQICTLKF